MKKIIISMIIVLMLLLCINASSAEDTFNETLTVTDDCDVSLDGDNSVYIDVIEENGHKQIISLIYQFYKYRCLNN